eukprot:NODE_30_length_3230_cov_362.232317_g27_i0.p1 GENE.NODE_30_length_3230_cov_362.232317_g27_i0~~NODE_30_length_3230_cov_362.232317_g27_i0.p1  ORF type:complete len:836 (-),score=-23.56 NODE_30_length_3230_cov_362.232317_g27_i0:332-2839(-)
MPQAGETSVGHSITSADSTATEQITAFADESGGWKTEVGGLYDPTMDSTPAQDSSLGSFLGRPVVIQSESWAVGSPLFFRFNPWEDFITHDRIKEKLSHYELLRCRMNVKIVISGTGFHYGRAMASYNPLTSHDDLTQTRNFLEVDLIAASQRPHFFLNPTNNEGGQLVLPFFWFHNYLSLSKKEYSEMGQISVTSFGNLLHANSGTHPVTVTVYAWASDVNLTMPTASTTVSNLVPQSGFEPQAGKSKKSMNSGDEYGQGIVSAPASAIARAAGELESIPIIAPFARATNIIASGVSAVARIFGFSRPNIITEQQLIKPMALGNLANTDASDAAQKLTVDSKCELTVDSRTVGLDGVDHMDYKSIATRESFLTSFDFKSSDAVDSLLWNTRVSPMAGDSNIGFATEYHLTSMAVLASVHKYWKGSIRYRFQIVKSNFHKGRIIVRYDPDAHGSTIDNATNYTRVVDLADTDDFEIVIGWAQNLAFLQVPAFTSAPLYHTSAARFLASRNDTNGILELNVLNQLVAPGPAADIKINVYVSMCDDFEFAYPSMDGLRNASLFVPQSGFEPQSGEDTGNSDKPTSATRELDSVSAMGQTSDHTMEVFFGEKLVSIRSLCKRYIFNRGWFIDMASANTFTISTILVKAFPLFRGWDPDGVDLDQPTGLLALTLSNSHYLNWFSPCYAARRGATRSKWVHTNMGTSNNGTLSVSQQAENSGYGITTTSSSLGTDVHKLISNRWGLNDANGASATNVLTNGALEVEVPFYDYRRFVSARQIGGSTMPGPTESANVWTYDHTTDGTSLVTLQRYCAAGEDFCLFFWTGPPVIYLDTITEAS